MAKPVENITSQTVLHQSHHVRSAIGLIAASVPFVHAAAAFAVPALRPDFSIDDGIGIEDYAIAADLAALGTIVGMLVLMLTTPNKTKVHQIGTSQEPAPPAPPPKKIKRTRWI